MPPHTTNEGSTTEDEHSTHLDTPPPTSFSSGGRLIPESIAVVEEEFSQQQFNTYSTVIQHPQNVDSTKKAQTVDEERDVESQEFIQHTTKDEGERGYVEQCQFDDVLQVEQAVNLSSTCPVHRKTSSPTSSLASSAQQEAFTGKYQPVEVLNGEGKWIEGYFVHKCLVVANLEGIERKYALYDESGAKYVFLGEIRLPRGN